MAKVGETDPRWIVAERADGTNVNNWHWCVHSRKFNPILPFAWAGRSDFVNEFCSTSQD